VDTEHHLPGSAAAGPPRPAAYLAVVLPDSPPGVHREPDVGAALEPRAQRPEQVAAEEPAADGLPGRRPLARVFRCAAVFSGVLRERGRRGLPRPPGALPRRPTRHARSLSSLRSACDAPLIFFEREDII
jgi:hypothetical protein